MTVPYIPTIKSMKLITMKKIPENENKRQKTFIEIYLSKSFNM